MAEIPRLDIRRAQLLVVDIQQKLLPQIADQVAVTAQCIKMIRAAQVLEIPLTLTQQYPQGLGETAPEIFEAAAGAPLLDKMTFSVWRESICHDRILELARPQVIVIGIESHVCVQQTAFDLLEAQHLPIILADAVGSRRIFDRDIALQRMRAAGIGITTVESAIFEMLERAGTDLFKSILTIVK